MALNYSVATVKIPLEAGFPIWLITQTFQGTPSMISLLFHTLLKQTTATIDLLSLGLMAFIIYYAVIAFH